MKRLLPYILIVAPLFSVCACGWLGHHYALEFDCVIDEVKDDGPIPQGGTVIEIPVRYWEAQTKFEPAIYCQPFRYRALTDGVEYSCAEMPSYISCDYSGEAEYLKVVVPENDSYLWRDVTVEVSLSAKYERSDWQQWREVYAGRQSPLDPGQPRRLEGIESWTVQFILDDTVMTVDMEDNEPARCLKAFLLDGDITIEVGLANNVISAYGNEAGESIRNHVPLLKKHYTKYSRGDIFMSDEGVLSIENETRKKGIDGNGTYLGRVAPSSLDDLDKLCHEDKYMGLGSFPMTLHLEK